MIKGDIDLTENLDFYRKKQLPIIGKIIPWISEKHKKLKQNHNSYNTNTTIDHYNREINRIITAMRYNDSSYIGDINFRVVENDDDLIEGGIMLENSDFVTTSITTSNGSRTYNTNWRTYTNWTDINSTYYRSPVITISTNSKKSVDYPWKSSKKKIDNTDNVFWYCNCCKNPMIRIGKNTICKSCSSEERIDENYLDTRDKISSIEKSTYISRLNRAYKKTAGWKDLLYNYVKSEIPWSSNKKRVQKRESIAIPWLRKLNHRVYRDYMQDLYEEQDYSSYLTNMNWIGIRQ